MVKSKKYDTIERSGMALMSYTVNEMVQGPCAHLQLHETSTVVLDRGTDVTHCKWNGPGTMCSPAATWETSTVVLDILNVIIDRLNVISSGSVDYMKIDAKVCFQGDHLVAIFEVQSSRNLVEMQTVPINTMLEYSRSNSSETCRLMVTFWTLTSVTFKKYTSR
jgi:chorismate mutase